MAEEQNRSLQDKFMLRLPDGMRDRIRDEAENAGRSMNAEIVARLSLTLDENVWERQKFIDLLNFKQNIIDKNLHTLLAHVSHNRSLKNGAEYERSMRAAVLATLRALCHAVEKDETASQDLKRMAQDVLAFDVNPALQSTDHRDFQHEIEAAIGDRDEIGPDWESKLSEEDKARLAERRTFAKDYE